MLQRRLHVPAAVAHKLLLAYFVVWVLMALGFAAVCKPSSFVYDFSMLRVVVCVFASAQAAWLLARKAKPARTFCLVTALLILGMSVVDIGFFGAYWDVADRLGKVGANLLIATEYLSSLGALYLLTDRASLDEYLSEELNNAPEGPGNSWDVPYRQRIRTWPFWRDLGIHFMVFSFIGHWAEILFCRLIVAGVFMGGYDPTNAMLWDQWLYPFSAEGMALAMVVLALHPLKEWLMRRFNGHVAPALLLSFLANALVCTSIDFGTGMVANQHFELWDYRDMPFNFMGQVCLQNSMVYSIAATIVVWLAYPVMDRIMRRLPRSHADALFVGIAGFYAFEALLHFVYIGM